MREAFAVAIGGAIGSVFRFWLSQWIHSFAGRSFPYGTLSVNILGCLLMGFLFVMFIDRLADASVARAAILIGVLGGFTTFSAFSIETINLIEQGGYGEAAVNIIASLGLCIGATWLGVIIGRQL